MAQTTENKGNEKVNYFRTAVENFLAKQRANADKRYQGVSLNEMFKNYRKDSEKVHRTEL